MESNAEIILIVTPNESIALTIKNELIDKVARENIYISPDAENALWLASDIKPTILILDYNEKVTHPLDLIHKIESIQRLKNIIIITENESPEYADGVDAKLQLDSREKNISIILIEEIVVIKELILNENQNREEVK